MLRTEVPLIAWPRVSKDHPCSICGRPDWCLVSPDGDAAICPRIEQGSLKHIEDSGWLHILNPSKASERRPRGFTICVDDDTPRPGFARLAGQYVGDMTPGRLQWLAGRLGVSGCSLQRLHVGWMGRGRFSFPMSAPDGQLIGIRVRTGKGRKFCIAGSRNGLFVPVGLSGKGPLLLAEGPTDCAAGLDLDFDCIGRPNANSRVAMTARICRGRDVVIIADNDPKLDGRCPGLEGAIKLAERLVFKCPSVHIILPPVECKDLRGWKCAGLTRNQLSTYIKQQKPIQLELV